MRSRSEPPEEPRTWREPEVRELAVWVEPEVQELDVRETSALPGRGADIGGNPGPDCQRS